MKNSERVYLELRELIVDWTYPPGAVLSESQLTERFGLSRTPVREALHRLSMDDLVIIDAGRSAVVSPVSLQGVVQLFHLREALETFAARLCARRDDTTPFEQLRTDMQQASLCSDDEDEECREYTALSRRFDSVLSAGTQNQYMASALEGVRGHAMRLRRIATRDIDRMREANAEHIAVCAAICEHHDVEAAEVVSLHLRNSLHNILKTLMEDAVGRTERLPAGLATVIDYSPAAIDSWALMAGMNDVGAVTDAAGMGVH